MNIHRLATIMIGLGLPFAAQAADLPVKRSATPPSYAITKIANWTGGYLGVIGGYGWASADINTADFGNDGSVTLKPDGWLIGPQIGYDYQLNNNVVIGIVGDYSWANLEGSKCVEFPSNLCGGSPNDSYATGKISQFGTVRGRLGYAMDNLLIYGTGGLAYADTTAQISYIDGVNSASAKAKAWGWTAGAGAEVKLASNMSLGVEYLYADFGNVKYDFASDAYAGTVPVGVNVTENILRGSLNYRF